ncbi:MAG: Histidine kinase, partial [Chloroflexota bacterium]|nr:Histidine kinase [Chloroflexota bacterium]
EHRSALARLELAERTLSRTWLFLERGDSSLVAPGDEPGAGEDVAMRIVEAQEAERARLAQDIHDGPIQALSNAIFQADYAERMSAADPAIASEIRSLRDLLRRELDNLRGFISQLRPPALDELGLDGAIEDAVGRLRATTALQVTTDLRAKNDDLDDDQQTVALRVTQEALQNVRKHAAASTVVVSTDVADDSWTLEIRDDGRGFDVGAVAARGRRNFGMQFMRERAELIDARFDVRSRPDGGTVVRLAIPTGARTGAKENG